MPMKPPVPPRSFRPMSADEAGSVKTIEQQTKDVVGTRKLWALQLEVDELERQVNETGGLDQYPGKTVPWVHSCLYGPISCRSARHPGIGTGHELLATVVDPTTPVLPRAQNLVIGRDGAWYWCATNVVTYLSWTYTADPGVGTTVAVRPEGVADIFDSVLEKNGGAILWQNISGHAFRRLLSPNISFELDFYDKKRGRSLTGGKVPGELFAGMGFGFRKLPVPQRFEEDSEIEPRLYPTEIRMTTFMDADAVFSVASVAAYVNLVFRGYRVLVD